MTGNAGRWARTAITTPDQHVAPLHHQLHHQLHRRPDGQRHLGLHMAEGQAREHRCLQWLAQRASMAVFSP
jgi:hypothetical protein